ncbi:hypothetical protein Y1Q_0020963 [Alligator mississippiensis]|uniref:Uncharacterized protein n=1 Tax=Alligator mississippiensis TaxID=8496 RepID=A0A151M1Q5_ALLMI|nr:hypothetical protein Y1Q_0020963 [Alligator mississippiensis]
MSFSVHIHTQHTNLERPETRFTLTYSQQVTKPSHAAPHRTPATSKRHGATGSSVHSGSWCNIYINTTAVQISQLSAKTSSWMK